ncbi:MAG: ArnT family glycosyltransferase [Sphingobacteriales bacterium]
MYQNRRSTYTGFILVFVAIKVVLNLFAMPHFGFQRDELLHLALGDHLAWGYKEVPPVIAVIAKLSSTLFGNSVFSARVFCTIFAGLIVWFTGLITVELGGRKFAIALACLAIILAPAFVASEYLLQPVIFDQFWWVLTVYLIVKYINSSSIKYLYFIGIAVGLGLLTKYTMGFFTLALVVGLLFTKQRRLLFNKHMLGAILVALVLFLPNIIWQFQHHLPIITHMGALRRTQLDYIKPSDFVSQQAMVNGSFILLWLTGFFFLIFSFKLRKYQFLAFAYIAIFLFLIEMNGKNYYLFGAYPMLFAAGGFGLERWIKNNNYILRTIVIILISAPNLVLLPMLLPVLPLNPTLAFFKFTDKHLAFFDFAVIWEDHQKHPTTQDYGDMFGWDEMTKKVADAYNSLTPDQQKHTIIWADNYGEAGAIHHFGKLYNLPDVYSLDSSFTLWTPPSLNPDYIIYVDDDNNVTKRLAPYVHSYKKVGEIDNPLAREKGTAIYLLTKPNAMFAYIYQHERAKKLLE